MQPRIAPIRSDLTETQIEALIKTDTSITIGRGMELLDKNLTVVTDITDDLQACTVSHDNFATLHGHLTCTLARQLTWGRAIVRPFVTIDNGVQKARFNMGAYFTNTPANEEDRTPAMFSVEGYDILNGLNNLVGDSYAINIGDNYLVAVEAILQGQGFTQYAIDPSRASTVAVAPKAWPIDDQTTWLMIVNEILSMVGYRSIYSDWDGRLICESHNAPVDRASEWTYTRGQFDGQLVPGTKINHDYFAAPNRWVGIRQSTQDTTGTVTLTEGNGIYTYLNETDGETSISARDQEITRVIQIEAADQAALVAAVRAEVAKDKAIGTSIEAATSCNPLHWHMDVVTVQTTTLGSVKVLSNTWSMDLMNKGNMSHSWAVL